MLASDRRLGARVPLAIFINQYVRDRPFRALTVNISDRGLYVNLIRGARINTTDGVVALEIALPDLGETLWARGEIRYAAANRYFYGVGLQITAMARGHARALRDFCAETRRRHLGTLLQAIHPLAPAPGRA